MLTDQRIDELAMGSSFPRQEDCSLYHHELQIMARMLKHEKALTGAALLAEMLAANEAGEL